MADSLHALALDLGEFLVGAHRASEMTGPEELSPDWRSWQIFFVYRGVRRHYIYHVERVDSGAAMLRALRADTTGELMVRIPDPLTGGVRDNTLYYPPHG